MPRRLRYHGVFDFPWSLPVSTDAVGITEKVHIGGHDISLHLPIIGSQARIFPPPDGIPANLDQPEGMPFRYGPEKEWGRRTGKDFYYISSATFSLLLPRQEDSSTPQEIAALREDFFEWFQIVHDWAAAWTGVKLGSKASENGSSFTLFANGKGWSHGGTLTIQLPTCAMNSGQVRGALQRASQGEHLPIEHRMLLSARSANEASDFRRAVIDAATGVEVALASHIARDLDSRQTPQEFIEKMIVDVNGLSSLFALCVRLGWPANISQQRLNNELTHVRNRAAHAGYTPTSTEARTVLAHAKSIVNSLRPLPKH